MLTSYTQYLSPLRSMVGAVELALSKTWVMLMVGRGILGVAIGMLRFARLQQRGPLRRLKLA